MEHRLKSTKEWFDAETNGLKDFTIRVNDRNPPYAVGDTVVFEEWANMGTKPTGRISNPRKIKYIYNGILGLEKGYVILGLEPMEKEPCKWCILTKEIYNATKDKSVLSPSNYCYNCGRKL